MTVSAGEDVFVLPTSFAQQRLWFLDRLVPDRGVYVSDVAIRLPVPVDLGALGWALDALVARHESLRTTFVAVDGVPFQRVLSGLHVPVESVVDAGELVRAPFDLERGPLLRAGWLADRGVLVVCVHHIVTDGWSMRIFFDELGELYRARVEGREPRLGALAIQYADFALWQRRRLSGVRLERLLGFWRAELEGLAALELVGDRPRPSVPSFRGATVPVRVPGGVVDGLRALAREQGATLFMALLAALAALLGRYGGQDDVAIGTPVAGRGRSELEPLIGFFVNTIVLRCDLSGDPSYRELLVRTRDRAIAAYAHQELPFERLVEDLQPDRDLGRNPLHQVMLQLQTSDVPVRAPDPAETVDKQTSIFDLSLDLIDAPGTLMGRVEYSTELFERVTVERLVARLQRLLAAVAADPDVPVGRVSLIAPGEDPTLRGRVVPIGERTLPELIDARAAAAPDAPAVAGWSYRRLTQTANALAHRLIAEGAGPESLIAVNLPRGPELVSVLLAIWKAGAAYLPLDPEDPPARHRQILSDARPLRVISELAEIPGRPDAPPPPRPDQLAYAIYTSGTTGTPKAALIEHRSVLNFVSWFATTVPLPLPWITRLAFDASLKQLLAPLIAGREVWVASEEAVADPAVLAREVAARDGVALNCVPTHWQAVLEAIASERAPSLHGRLKMLVLGGERLPQALAERTLRLLPGVELWNVYGPTETTSVATAARVRAGDRLTIGWPIDNVEARVVDGHGAPVPVGAPGELWLGGAGVARGYLRRPRLTAQRFRDGGYLTGDRVRARPDGALEFLGRLDDQIKLAGHRIEPAEIEHHLAGVPGVGAAAVTCRGGQLIAHVTGTADPGRVRAHLRARLPAHMIPARIVRLERLPRTANGKLDTRALPAPAPPRPVGRRPTGILERRIAAIWQDVLGLPEVGVHDNFFDLGGRSLLLVRVHARLTSTLGRPIAMLDLFRHPTIHTLATHLNQEPR
jgi:amino acid adenylation domain-containing protein